MNFRPSLAAQQSISVLLLFPISGTNLPNERGFSMLGRIVLGLRRIGVWCLLAIVAVIFSADMSRAQSAVITDDAFVSSNPVIQLINQNGQGSYLVVAGPNAAASGIHGGATTAYLKFQLQASLPPSVAATNVVKATLKLYLSTATNPTGSIDIY